MHTTTQVDQAEETAFLEAVTCPHEVIAASGVASVALLSLSLSLSLGYDASR